MVPTYFRRELRDRALQRRLRLRAFPLRYSIVMPATAVADYVNLSALQGFEFHVARFELLLDDDDDERLCF